MIMVLINSLMAVVQLQNYRRMMDHEIVSFKIRIQSKDDIGEMLEKSDQIARNITRSIVLASIISIVMIILMAFFVSRALHYQFENGTGMPGK